MADAVKFVIFTYYFLHFIQEITHGTQFQFFIQQNSYQYLANQEIELQSGNLFYIEECLYGQRIKNKTILTASKKKLIL